MANTNETYAARIQRKLMKKQYLVEVATGRRKADLVLKNASYVNVFSNELCHGDIAVAKGQIVGMGDYAGEVEYDVSGKIVCPGFIDAHIHLESSLVSPREFVRAVLPHGTTTVITDPHEITNVMGTDGIDYMLQATEGLPIDVRFMLPSCVPATPLDESGANLDYRAIDSFYDHARVQGLAEMMNYVGVVGGDKEVIAKIVAAQAHHKKIDGHAPGLSGKALAAYIAAGVYSDHECSDMDDAMAKLRNGQFIMIRDGTAAHNLEALVDLLRQPYYDRCMFCTDDKHPSDLLEKGHIDYLIRKAIHYLLSCNIGEILTIFLATLLAFPHAPLTPVQLLWLNLVTDSLPALALGMEPVEENVMSKPPRGKQEPLFSKAFSWRLAWQGCLVGGITLLAYALGLRESYAVAGTMAFATLTFSQLFHAFDARSEDTSLFHLGVFSNPAMNKAFLAGLLLQGAVLLAPPLQGAFSVAPMALSQWGTVLGLALTPLVVCEIEKAVRRARRKQPVSEETKAPAYR